MIYIRDCFIRACVGTKNRATIYNAVERNTTNRPIEVTLTMQNEDFEDFVKFLKEKGVQS